MTEHWAGGLNYWLARVAVTALQNGRLARHTSSVSQLWRLEVQDLAGGKVDISRGLSWACRQSSSPWVSDE